LTICAKVPRCINRCLLVSLHNLGEP